MKKSDVIIYETSEYDKFSFLIENREVTENRNLLDAIKNNNKLRYNPIIVGPQMQVLDGQHRLTIARQLGVPVYYVVDNDAKTEDMQTLNNATKNWKIQDHVDFFAKSGNQDYKWIKSLCEEFNIPLMSFCQIFCTTATNRSAQVRKGKAKLKYDVDKIHKTLTQLKDIQEKYKYYGRSAFPQKFLNVVLQLMLHEDYDHDRFLRSIDRYPDSFIKASRYLDMAFVKNSLLNDVYNKRFQDENRIEL